MQEKHCFNRVEDEWALYVAYKYTGQSCRGGGGGVLYFLFNTIESYALYVEQLENFFSHALESAKHFVFSTIFVCATCSVN